MENNKKWIDWQGEIIIDEIGKKGTVIGRNFAYKQVVVEGDESMMGKLIKIKIEEVTPFYLIGKRID